MFHKPFRISSLGIFTVCVATRKTQENRACIEINGRTHIRTTTRLVSDGIILPYAFLCYMNVEFVRSV